jgi:ribonuclease Z
LAHNLTCNRQTTNTGQDYLQTDVILTGTGYPRPHALRAGPGMLVRRGTTILQFDAGRGTAMRLAALDISCRDLSAVFISHHHSDHMVALPDLVLSRWTVRDRDTEDSPLEVVVPQGPAQRFAEHLLDNWSDEIAVRCAHTQRASRPALNCRSYTATESAAVIWNNADLTVAACKVHHEPVDPAMAFKVSSDEGVVVISGDTRVCDEVAELAADADVLVHEVIRRKPIENTGYSHILDYHAESVALGRMAAEIGVPVLMLTHLIPAPDTADEEAQYVDEIRAGGYRGEIIVGQDLSRVTLPLNSNSGNSTPIP